MVDAAAASVYPCFHPRFSITFPSRIRRISSETWSVMSWIHAVYASYGDARGAPAFYPAMMTALLLYAYTQGLYSSRRISRAYEERFDFQAVTESARPDFRTISECESAPNA